MCDPKKEITISDLVFHYRAKWLRRIALCIRELGINAHKQAAEEAQIGQPTSIIRLQVPSSVLNALLKQGFSLRIRGNTANYREKVTILKGKTQFTLVNEGEFWWAVPVEGEIAEGIRIFPLPFGSYPQGISLNE